MRSPQKTAPLAEMPAEAALLAAAETVAVAEAEAKATAEAEPQARVTLAANSLAHPGQT